MRMSYRPYFKYDAVLKDCIALMMPDETFLMRFEMESDFWFEMLIDRACQARSAKLSRPVYRNEYFEVS